MTINIKLLVYCATCLNISLAQSAMDYFHRSANNYVDGQFVAAINTIDEGLRHYPDDPNLNSLSGKLKIPKSKPNQQQQQGQEQNQDSQNQENENQENKDQSKKDQNNKQEEQNQNSEEKQDQKDQEQSKQNESEEQKEQEKQSSETGENKEGQPKSDDRVQAEAILNALKDKEQINQKRQISRAKTRKLEKDW